MSSINTNKQSIRQTYRNMLILPLCVDNPGRRGRDEQNCPQSGAAVKERNTFRGRVFKVTYELLSTLVLTEL